MEIRYESSFPSNGWLFNRMNGFLSDFQPRVGGSGIRPAVDVVEDKDGYHFYFDMPGLKNDSFDLRVEDGNLTVTAERNRLEWSKEAALHFSERHYGTFRRSFELPKDASHDQIHASYKDGVLEVTVEKRPDARPVKIQIN
ncbi:MAG TPA: Hsp20/alpha crystallin family protein [Candidatus Binataceae bacterium]|nr:Hsp20/alpha crystallin family protein [Candidatus Binataceae bacterium]